MRTADTALHAAQLHGGADGSQSVAAEVAVMEPVESATTIDAAVDSAEFNEPAKSARKPSKWAPRVAWGFSMIAIGGIVGVVIILGMKFIDGPVEANASTITLAKSQATTAPVAADNVLGGLTFELSYPGVFDQLGTVKNDANAVEQYNASSRSNYARLIAVSVRALPSGNVADDSSYRFRQISPKDYTSGNVMLHGETAAVFTKTDHTERTLFWAHRGRVLTVSITSTDPRDDLDAYMTLVEKTARWKK